MKKLDESNSLLLSACNKQCLKLYTMLFECEFEYEDLHLLPAFTSTKKEDSEILLELGNIAKKLYEYSILEGETKQDKIEKYAHMKQLLIQMRQLEKRVCSMKFPTEAPVSE